MQHAEISRALTITNAGLCDTDDFEDGNGQKWRECIGVEPTRDGD
jgi:hypothetical protein